MNKIILFCFFILLLILLLVGNNVARKDCSEVKTKERYSDMKSQSNPANYKSMTTTLDSHASGMICFTGKVIKIQPAEEISGTTGDLYHVESEESEVYLVEFYFVPNLDVGDRITVYGLHMLNTDEYQEYGKFIPNIIGNMFEEAN